MIELTCCPSTLQKGFSTYSPVALKELFNSQKVNHILPYSGMDNNETKIIPVSFSSCSFHETLWANILSFS